MQFHSRYIETNPTNIAELSHVDQVIVKINLALAIRALVPVLPYNALGGYLIASASFRKAEFIKRHTFGNFPRAHWS